MESVFLKTKPANGILSATDNTKWLHLKNIFNRGTMYTFEERTWASRHSVYFHYTFTSKTSNHFIEVGKCTSYSSCKETEAERCNDHRNSDRAEEGTCGGSSGYTSIACL